MRAPGERAGRQSLRARGRINNLFTLGGWSNKASDDIGFDESDWAEVALRFTLSCDVHTAIIGTTNPDHVRANIEAAARGPLPEETIDKLREAFVEAVADAGEEWPGQT